MALQIFAIARVPDKLPREPIRPSSSTTDDAGVSPLAQPRRRLDQVSNTGLQIERRAADHLEHVGGGRLLLRSVRSSAPDLVEQADVLDRDHRLVGEGRHQFDLLIGERAHLVAR